MKRLLAVILVSLFTFPVGTFAGKDSPDASISKFKAESLYRAVKLKWKVQIPFENEVVFRIVRSESFVEGPYEEIATVPYDKGKRKYEYLDKSLGSESNYYYKLIVKGTGETYGPVSARPFFSPPAT